MTPDQVLAWHENWKRAQEAAAVTMAAGIDAEMHDMGYERDGGRWIKVPVPRQPQPAPQPLPAMPAPRRAVDRVAA